jgi:Zn-dependent protease
MGRIRIARILGIPIFLDYTWFIVLGLITWTLAAGYFPAQYPDLPVATYWAKGLVAALLLFASVLVHELGHSIVALRNGIGIVSITLFIFGGVARLREEPRTPWVEFEVAIAGPLASFLLAAIFFGATWLGAGAPAVAAVTSYLATLNLVLGGFNLVPALPLDGGRMLRAAVWKFTTKTRATRVASGSGTLFAYLLILNGVLVLVTQRDWSGFWLVFLGWFLKDAAAGAYQQARLVEAFAGRRVRDLMLSDPVLLPASHSLDAAVRDYFLRLGYGGFPVEDGGAIVGLLSLAEVKKFPRDRWARVLVREAMRPLDERATVGADEDPIAALLKMAGSDAGRLLVLDAERRCVGLITHRGVLDRLRVEEQLAA